MWNLKKKITKTDSEAEIKLMVAREEAVGGGYTGQVVNRNRVNNCEKLAW